MLKIGISGHINIEDENGIRNRIDYELGKFVIKNKNAKRIAYTALAAGADTIFAEVALKHHFELQVILPFPEEEYEKDFNGDAAKVERFQQLLKKATKISRINSEHKEYNGDQRKQAYYDCGVEICNEANELIFVWNGMPANGKGGTGGMVEYARKNKLSYLIIYTPFNWFWKNYIIKDEAAKSTKGKYENRWIFCWTLSVIASLLFAVNLSYVASHEANTLVAFTELLFFSIILYIWYNNFRESENKKINLKEDSIQKRRDAERMRCVDVMINSRIHPDFLKEDNHIRISDEVEKDIKKIIEDSKNSEIAFKKDEAKKVWMQLIAEQLAYHHKNILKIHPVMQRVEWLQKIILILFMIGLFTHAVELAVHCHWLPCKYEVPVKRETLLLQLVYIGSKLPLFLCLICPPLYAALEVLSVFNGWKKKHADSKLLITFFNETEKRIHSNEDINLIAADIFWEMEADNKDWYKQKEAMDNIPM